MRFFMCVSSFFASKLYKNKKLRNHFKITREIMTLSLTLTVSFTPSATHIDPILEAPCMCYYDHLRDPIQCLDIPPPDHLEAMCHLLSLYHYMQITLFLMKLKPIFKIKCHKRSE